MLPMTDERREIIKLIPELIKSLTKFKDNDENFHRSVEFACNITKHYRSISTNSHEIKQKLDGILEKFIVENMEEKANYLKKLCDYFVNHPLCKNHYELDIQWKILDFLLTVSYNPTGKLRKTSTEELKKVIEEILEQQQKKDVIECKSLIDELQKDFILNPRKFDSSDSDSNELSKFSFDSETNKIDSPVFATITNKNALFKLHKNIEKSSVSSLNLLQKYQNVCNYELFIIYHSQAVEMLKKSVQYSWWYLSQEYDKKISKMMCSSYEDVNFCIEWTRHRKQITSNRQNQLELINCDVQIITEYQFLCEVIWMFYVPTSCKVFEISRNNDIKIRNKISLASTTIIGFEHLVNFVLPYIKMITDLRVFIKTHLVNKQNQTLSKTYEFYTAALEELLEPFYEKLFKIENMIKSQIHANIVSSFIEQMNEEFSYLQNIYTIHKACILDYATNPPHICSAFLLTSLLSIFRMSSSVQLANLSATLFLSSIKAFCDIIDIWWTDGRLDDWKNEFLIEKFNKIETADTCLRLYEKSKEKSFFVASEISKIIQKSTFFKLLIDYTLEAGYTLNLLTKIQKIKNFKDISNYEDNLYNSFINDVLTNVDVFQCKEILILNNTNRCQIENDKKYHKDKNEKKCVEIINLINEDLLRMVFESSNTKRKWKHINDNVKKNSKKRNKSIGDIYKTFQSTAKQFLPLEEIICKSFSKVLQQRISCANEFVVKIYHNEFKILKHLQNLRRILLFESNDLMSTFYTKLFTQIESGKNWMNPFILTVQLDNIIYSRFPDMSSLFRIEIKSSTKIQTTKVIEAVDKLFITYNLKKELKNIINDSNIVQYNKIFQFLLKVKWSLWTLENLRFPKSHKTRIPYADYKMIDFLMRRLEQLRFWIMYALQCIHFHLMSCVLQAVDAQLDQKIQNCKKLSEIKFIHESYLNMISKHCFINEQNFEIRKYIEQLLNLVYIIRLKWESCLETIESDQSLNNLPSLKSNDNYIMLSEIGAIESTYVDLHQSLAKLLNNEAYIKDQIHLLGLSAAFNTSVPY